MGYKRAKLYKLTFEDHPGLEVSMKGLSVRGLMAVSRHAGAIGDLEKNLAGLKGQALDAALGAADELFAKFADALVTWNLEDEAGEPVPATLDGVMSQDFEFILELTLAWMDAVASVDSPLSTPSPSTPPSGLGLSEATVPLSPNPGN